MYESWHIRAYLSVLLCLGMSHISLKLNLKISKHTMCCTNVYMYIYLYWYMYIFIKCVYMCIIKKLCIIGIYIIYMCICVYIYVYMQIACVCVHHKKALYIRSKPHISCKEPYISVCARKWKEICIWVRRPTKKTYTTIHLPIHLYICYRAMYINVQSHHRAMHISVCAHMKRDLYTS